MNFIVKSSLAILLLCLMSLSACQTDDDNDLESITAQALANKNFFYTDYKVSANSVTITTFATLDPCFRDDFYRFNLDGSGYISDNTNRCDSIAPPRTEFFWALLSNDTKLVIDYGGSNVDVYNILINNGSTLKLESNRQEDVDNDGDNENVTTTITLTR